MSVRKIAFVLMLLICFSLIGLASAAEQNCSIALRFSYKGKAVSGGSITLFCVTGLAEDASAQTARALAGQVSELDGETKSIKQGHVLFDSLSPGIYLVVQQKSIPGFLPISPFLIRLPTEQGGSVLEAVIAAPKLAPCPGTPETGDPRWPFTLFRISGAALILALIDKKYRLR